VSRKGYPATTALYSIAKRCSTCQEMIGIEHKKCPCCGTKKLRTKPRRAESKRRILAGRLEQIDLNRQFREYELNAAKTIKALNS
jgi:reverse gyrase